MDTFVPSPECRRIGLPEDKKIRGNGSLDASPDTMRYLTGSKFIDKIDDFKDEIFKICKLLSIHRVELFQLNKERDELKVLLSFSMDSKGMNTVGQRLVLADNPNFEFVAKTGRTSTINFPGFGIDVAMPIGQSGLVVGFDSNSDDKVFEENELLLLKQVGTSIAISYDAGYMTMMNGTDALTQIGNRLALNHYIDGGVDIFGKKLPAIKVIIFFDIDHFRQFNNIHGHHVGDVILQHTAMIVKKRLAEIGGSLFRYGGEEFVGVIPVGNDGKMKISKERLFTAIDSIRQEVEKTVCICEGQKHSVTMSVGYCVVKKNGSPKKAIRDANEAEHEAKIKGRNVTVEFVKNTKV